MPAVMGSPTSRAVTSPPALATAPAADAMSDALSRLTRIVTEYDALGMLMTTPPTRTGRPVSPPS